MPQGPTFANVGYVPHGQVAMTASGKEPLHDRSIGQLFLGERRGRAARLRKSLAAIVYRQV